MLQGREIAVLLYIQKQTASQKMDSILLLNIVFRFCFLLVIADVYIYSSSFNYLSLFIRFTNFIQDTLGTRRELQ